MESVYKGQFLKIICLLFLFVALTATSATSPTTIKVPLTSIITEP